MGEVGDNPKGSNTTGYASGFSDYDTGWFVDTNMSVPDWKAGRTLLISPNPCDEYARISLENEEGYLQLIDSRGKAILDKPFLDEAILSTAELSPGIYLLRLVTRDGEKYPARLVVLH